MQGFILHTQRVRDEDLIVYILSPKTLLKTYRFYGLRHSSILSGYKIDFALEENSSFLPRLKNVLHLGFLWILDREKMLFWQEFIRLLYGHLKEVSELDSFYFDLLDECAKRFLKQNPKRVILDAYVRILEFEGRLHTNFICFACDEKIRGNITLLRAFLPSHDFCAFSYEFPHQKLEIFYEKKNCSIFNDEEINKLYELVKQGL
ncbi:recombination protein RecO [Campylobacter upsaliensis]|uniref:recombination protein RecO n=1 Tax=Campylobacter upsaliensis TaxID=28080 RepID=UPI00214A05D2|nr:recombination protein RecO [Campylobacter upsaliensis]MCR2107789.1 recombination protein RecO [Campylobacter upsaliensis]